MKIIIARTVVSMVLGLIELLIATAAVFTILAWREWWKETLYFLLFVGAIVLIGWSFLTVLP